MERRRWGVPASVGHITLRRRQSPPSISPPCSSVSPRTAIGSEAGNADVKKSKLPATATAAQRSAFDENYIFNEETKQTEHKDTIIAHDELRGADSKAAPGRLRYKHGTKMAIISEDSDGTGYWQGRTYQVLYPSAGGGRTLKTKAGPLLLDGLLEVGFARILEVRKRVGDGSVRHPRLSMRRSDASCGEAVLLPLVRDVDDRLLEDRSRPPYVVPLAWLGCQVEVRQFASSRWRCMSADVFEVVRLEPACGGEPLCTVVLEDNMFAADVMVAEAIAFEEMKVRELKGELMARGASRTGVKGTLQQRLHTLIVQEAAERARARAATDAADF